MGYGRRSYSGDPHWIACRFPGECAACGAKVARGSSAFFFPNGRRLECSDCGATSARRFEAEAADEELLSGSWS